MSDGAEQEVVRRIAVWLRRAPVPESLRLDGDPDRIVRCQHGKWSETERTIRAMGCTSLEALGKDGRVLRATRVDCEAASTAPRVTPGEAIGDGLAKLNGAGTELAQLATIITTAVVTAGDRGAERHESAYRTAFEALREVTNMVCARLAGIEQAWIETLNRRAEEVEEARSAEHTAAESSSETMIADVMRLATQRSGLVRMQGPAERPRPKGGRPRKDRDTGAAGRAVSEIVAEREVGSE